MGLDTTHGAWSGGYGSFSSWRNWLANKIGIQLNEMEGFLGSKKWKQLPPDDLHILLNHSDCDGHISWKDCGKIAKRLSEILSTKDKADTENAYNWNKLEIFMNGCNLAFSKKQKLEFR